MGKPFLLFLFAFAVGAVSAARYETVDVDSPSMGGSVRCLVVLPDSYRADGGEFPVVYFLHGAGGSEKTWRTGTDIRGVVDRYGFVGVCPDGKDSWWLDAPALPSSRYETHVVKELLPFVERRYRVRADRGGRALLGESMGGFGACYLGFRHKDLFATVVNAFGGLDLTYAPDGWNKLKLFGPDAEHPEYRRDRSIAKVAEGLRNGEVNLLTVIGTDDEYFLPCNRQFHKTLAARGIAHTYVEVRGADRESSRHSMKCFNDSLDLMARFVAGHFTEAPERTNVGVVEKGSPWSRPVKVGSRLQLLWDDDLADARRTTAERLQHRPELAGTVHVFDRPWEGDCCFYQILVKDADRLRIYYKASGSRLCQTYSPGKFERSDKALCSVIESRDGGLTWTRPDFNRVKAGGTTHNNVLFDENRDNFYVFRDSNPDCPKEELYKALAMWGAFNANGTPDLAKGKPGLWCYVSANGTDFRRDRLASSEGAFDSINTAFWDATRGLYHAYVRGYHGRKGDRNGDTDIRDVRHMTSKDFRTWTRPQLLDFGPDGEDYPLYTNGIHPYYREPSVFIGFPSRYVERKKWTDNFEKLCAPEKRRARMEAPWGKHPRGGLTTWDTVFCFSRDGQRFDRFDEAMFRPGPEHPDKNWAYGDTMVTVGEIESPGRFGVDPEISMFVLEGAHLGVPAKLNRYTIRLDGYVSRHAPYAGARFVTKPIVFSGSELELNFSTSARGFVYVTVRDENGRELKSTELFGDKVDRIVGWETGEAVSSPLQENKKLSSFAGKPVTLEFDMSDADIYSFRFK